jgi:hypothetical protein
LRSSDGRRLAEDSPRLNSVNSRDLSRVAARRVLRLLCICAREIAIQGNRRSG